MTLKKKETNKEKWKLGADKQTECRCLKKLNMDIAIKTCHPDSLQGQAGLRQKTEQE